MHEQAIRNFRGYHTMSLMDLIKANASATEKQPHRLVDVIDLERHFEVIEDRIEGLRFSKRDLAHELALMSRENARMENQVSELKERLEALEALLEARLQRKI